MEVIIGVSVVLVQFFVYNIATDISVCVQNVTGRHECCSDYRNVSGKCEKCIGSFGKNCTYQCSNDYYGHGCRHRCNCTEQFEICDSKYGCTESVSESGDTESETQCGDPDNRITLCKIDSIKKRKLMDSTRNSSSISYFYEYGFCGFMVLLLLGVIIYFYQKLRKRNMSSGRSSANVGEKQDIQEDGVYTDVKEPRIHDQSRNFDLPTYFCDNNTEPNRIDRANKKIPSQVRLPSTRSEMLNSNVYDFCNRLNSPSSSPIYSRVIKHDYDLACIKSSKSLSESKLKDNNCSQYHKENNVGFINKYDEFRPMMNRPYSYVKYDWQTTADTNNV